MKPIIVVAFGAIACTTARTAPRPLPTSFDIVIANGRIVDGTGNPWFQGDVGLIGDRIARVGPKGSLARVSAKRYIDATGLVVAPGFIDIQSHSWDPLLWRDGRVVGKVTQASRPRSWAKRRRRDR